MKINLKNGIDKLIFGMKQRMLPLYGKPDRNYKDEDDNDALPTTNSSKSV
jgi:hypothetical protein